MLKFRRLFLKVLLAVIISLSGITIAGDVTVRVAEAATLTPSVRETKKTLYVGADTYKIEYKNLSSKAVVTYKSNNTKVAQVSKNGIITPAAKGTAAISITVKQSGKTYPLSVNVTVMEPYIELTTSTDYLNSGEAFILKAKTYGIKDKVKWSVSDKDIASINSGGKLSALKTGNVTVYASAAGYRVQCDVVVGSNRIGVFTKDLTIYDDTTIWFSISDYIEGEKLNAKVSNSKVLDFDWGKWTSDNKIPLTITPKGIGTDVITVKSTETNDMIKLHVTVVSKPKNRKELSAKDVYAKCGPSTVEILSDYGEDMGQGQGSGFFIGDGMIVTNYHVIEGAESIQVTTYDNKKFDVDRIIGYDKDLDLAVIGVTAVNDGLTISRDGAFVGENVYALGSPLGLTGTLSNGIVSTASRLFENVDYIQITASISPGNSGGPLLNSYGEVIGINSMYYADGQNLNFAINIKELNKISTNRPLTMQEYYDQYNKQMMDDFESRKITEDPTISQDVKTCQNVSPMSFVAGTIQTTENGDCYWFEVKEPTILLGMIKYDNPEDIQHSYFDFYDSNLDFVCEGENNEEEGYQYVYYNLTPGKYYVFINLPLDYTGADLNYLFMLQY